jgi:hypothetical protein
VGETQKAVIQWPKNSWAILTKIIRAWYTVEQGSGEVTQKKIAEIADVQQSQVSTNKAFLQAIGILTPDGSSLTEAGKRIGIGISGDNESMLREGLQLVIKSNTLLSHMLDVIRGRGELKVKNFSDEIALRMNGKTDGFATGVTILQEILVSSGSIELVGDTLRPLFSRTEERYREPGNGGEKFNQKPPGPGLKRIPIPVSTSSVWWVEVGDTPVEGEIDKFLEMQRLMFGTKQNK